MSITDMTLEQELMLIEWVRETYYDHQKMMDNQLYQLKLKLLKWRTMEDDEVKAGDLKQFRVLCRFHLTLTQRQRVFILPKQLTFFN